MASGMAMNDRERFYILESKQSGGQPMHSVSKGQSNVQVS
jgi:hypothetical protein